LNIWSSVVAAVGLAQLLGMLAEAAAVPEVLELM
jgi:hypothetical protein